jgi:hypothetical protein
MDIDPEPETRTMTLEFEYKDEGDDEVAPRDDSYVIGEDGDSVTADDVDGLPEPDWHTRPWAKPAAFGLVALFVVLTTWNVIHFVQGPPEPPKPTPFQSKQALYLGVMKIDAFRRTHGVVPESLTEAGLPLAEGYAYERMSPTRYVISFKNGGAKLEYDSSDPKESFFGSPKDMLTMGDSK